MSADTAALPAAPRRRTAALRRLTLTELTLFIRERVSIIWGIGFPLVLLIIFGNIPGFRKPASPAAPGCPSWTPTCRSCWRSCSRCLQDLLTSALSGNRSRSAEAACG